MVGVGGTLATGPIGGGIFGGIAYKISDFFTKRLTKKMNKKIDKLWCDAKILSLFFNHLKILIL